MCRRNCCSCASVGAAAPAAMTTDQGRAGQGLAFGTLSPIRLAFLPAAATAASRQQRPNSLSLPCSSVLLQRIHSCNSPPCYTNLAAATKRSCTATEDDQAKNSKNWQNKNTKGLAAYPLQADKPTDANYWFYFYTMSGETGRQEGNL